MSETKDLNHQGHQVHQAPSAELDALARAVVDSGLAVHRALGPGLLEAAYQHCLAYELGLRGIASREQVALPVSYKGTRLDAGYRIDLLIHDRIIVELKAQETLLPIHEAQLITYLKLSGLKLGFLINFNVALFKNGVRRFVL